MSSFLLEGPCPNPKCQTPTKYKISHLEDSTRVLEATCDICGSYKAYDGARNIIKLAEEV